jgi:hypothetical protein
MVQQHRERVGTVTLKENVGDYRPSVVVVDELEGEPARSRGVVCYSVGRANYGMLHSYSTVVSTEKSMWVPFSGYESDEI